MRNFLIPTGVAYFPDNYMELLRMIGSIDGTLDDENRFHCKVPFPRTNFGTYGPLVFFISGVVLNLLSGAVLNAGKIPVKLITEFTRLF